MRREKDIPIMTILLFAVNVCVYIITMFTGDFIPDHGGSYWPLIIYEHQYYRIITHFFIHFGFGHLFNNMVSLLILGYSLEGILGRGRFMLLYFLSGTLAGIASLVYTFLCIPQENAPLSCGASGAVYGLMGALLVLLLINDPEGRSSQVPRYILFLGLSLYSGMMDTSIDNAAHIGGFIAGFIICLIMYRTQKRRRKTWREL